MTTLNWKAWDGERAKPSPMELPVACLFSDGAILVGMSHKFTWDRVSNVSRNKPTIVAWREPTKEEVMQLRSNGDVMFMVETETKELFSSADGPDGMGERKPRETICKITIHDNRLSADRICAVMDELGSRLTEFNDAEQRRQAMCRPTTNASDEANQQRCANEFKNIIEEIKAETTGEQQHTRKGTLHFKCLNMDELTSIFGIEPSPDFSEKRKARVNPVRCSAKGGDTGYRSLFREMWECALAQRDQQDQHEKVDLEQARTAAEFLSRADSTINQRGKDYDTESGERSGEPVAIAFNALTGKSITGAEVYLIQQLLKDRRQWTAQQFHYDSALDSVSFAALKSEALANENKEES